MAIPHSDPRPSRASFTGAAQADAAERADPPPKPCRSVAELANLAARCRDCPLWENATQTVFGAGNPHAALVLVGEQPGDKEDLAGEPFVGPAGQLLDRALIEAGIDRDAAYVTNAVKHFKFEWRGKRRLHKSPGQREMAACQQWLIGELELIRPKAVVALGASAARALLGKGVSVKGQRGSWVTPANGWPVLLTVHPSYLLRLRGESRGIEYGRFVEELRQATAVLGRRGTLH